MIAELGQHRRGDRADAAGGTVDQNLLPGPHLGDVDKSLQRGQSRHRDRRRLLKS